MSLGDPPPHNGKFRFDRSVNAGHVLVFLAVVTSTLTIHVTAITRTSEHELRITWLEKAHAKNLETANDLGEIKRVLAVVRDRIDQQRDRVDYQRDRPDRAEKRLDRQEISP